MDYEITKYIWLNVKSIEETAEVLYELNWKLEGDWKIKRNNNISSRYYRIIIGLKN